MGTQMEETNQEMEEKTDIRYLALGDSYTIGESVPEQGRFPLQLSDSLVERGYEVEETKIIARTGWTTDELQAAIDKEALDTAAFNLVTLLIGVNNQYRGYPIEKFETEFERLLQQAIEFAGDDTSRVFVVSIPDYGVTPFAANRNPSKIGREIDQYNSMKERISSAYGVVFVNITPISRAANNDPSLIAGDQLHPSAKMYTLWVGEILPKVLSAM